MIQALKNRTPVPPDTVSAVRSVRKATDNDLRDMNRKVVTGFMVANDERANLYQLFKRAGLTLAHRDVWRIATIIRKRDVRDPVVYMLLQKEDQGNKMFLCTVSDYPPYLDEIKDDQEWAELKDFCEKAILNVEGAPQFYKFADLS